MKKKIENRRRRERGWRRKRNKQGRGEGLRRRGTEVERGRKGKITERRMKKKEKREEVR